MDISFEQPVWLWGLLAIIPLCLVALTGFSSMSRVRRLSAALARAALTTLIVAMLAGAQSVRSTERLAVIGVVDVSGSVLRFGDTDGTGSGYDPAELARRYFTDRLENRGADDLFGLVVFDGRATTIATPSRSTVLDRSFSVLPIEGSDIAGALRHAAAIIPPDAAGRIVLISDGNPTGADPVEAAASLGSGDARVPVDTVPIGYSLGDEVIVEELDAPPRAAAGATVPLRVRLRSTGRGSGTLRLLREGEPVDLGGPGGGRRVELRPGRHVELLDVKLEPGRLSRFKVIFEPDPAESGNGLAGDGSLTNNRAEAFTITPGESRVLVVDGVSEGLPEGAGAALPRALSRSGLSVETVAPSGVPRDLLGLQSYDAVILQNVPADALPSGSMDRLTVYTRELGGGVVVVGGPDTLGAGGWRGSAIEPLLPVRLDLPEKLVVPEAAIVLVLDNSGSMRQSVLGSSRTQQEIANESAARAIRSLDPGDLIGVIAFNSAPSVVAELGPAADKEKLEDATRGIVSGGGTNLPPALRIAREQLLGVEAKHKHIIVLSDGQSRNAEALETLAQSINDEGIRITAIAVGDGADLATLERVALAGRGAFYHVINPSVLPNVFLKAVRVERSPLVREQTFTPAILDPASPLIAGLDTPPPLRGLVLTQAKEDPTITYTMASPSGDPLLAHWAVGLGRVAVFTSDAHDWAQRWLGWPGYQTMWTRVVRLIGRAAGNETGELRVAPSSSGSALSIVYEALDARGEPIDLLSVPATVYGPDGAPHRLTLRQTGPGLYTGEAPAMRGGNHLVIARPSLGADTLPPLISGVTVNRNDEYARLAPGTAALERIAEASGGRTLGVDTPADLFDRSSLEPRRARTPLWPVLLVWTLAVFLLDVGTRRIAWDRLLGERGGVDQASAVLNAGERAAALRGAKAAAKDRAQPTTRDGAAALGDRDAEKLSRATRAKRYQTELDRARGARKESPAAETPASAKAKKAGRPTEPTEPESGLLAAKRRARQRFEEDQS